MIDQTQTSRHEVDPDVLLNCSLQSPANFGPSKAANVFEAVVGL